MSDMADPCCEGKLVAEKEDESFFGFLFEASIFFLFFFHLLLSNVTRHCAVFVGNV